MSVHGFMNGGGGELVKEIDTGPPMNYHIKVYEIDDPNFVGVEYGPGDKQAQPRSWWEGRIPAYVPPPVEFKLKPRARA